MRRLRDSTEIALSPGMAYPALRSVVELIRMMGLCRLTLADLIPSPLNRAFHGFSWVAFAVLLPTALGAQSIQTISPQQCVWHAGDNLAWATPNLDDSGWQPLQDWKPQPGQPRLWVRCHVVLGSGNAQPAIQVTLYSAHQLYLDGVLIGAEGNLYDGNSSLDAIRSYLAPSRLLASGPATIALRITYRGHPVHGGPIGEIVESLPLQVRAGDAILLDAMRARVGRALVVQYAPTAIAFGAVGILAIVPLFLYFHDRSRPELLLLSITCLSVAIVRIDPLAAAAFVNYSVSASLWIFGLGEIGAAVTVVPFFYALARRRIPWPVLALILAMASVYILTWMDAYAAANQPVWLGAFDRNLVRPLTLLSHLAISFLPFFVFGPWRAIPRRMRPLAALCMLWGAADIVWYAVQATGMPIPGVPNLFIRWGLTVLAVRAFTTACVLAALLALLFREQRQAVEERAILAGEMQAAQQVQRMLAPESIRSLPGFNIGVAFLPAREVGGDFYSCLILPGNCQRILLGDVSGKGAAAAMTAAVLLGAAQRHDSDSPSVLLDHLNRVMTDMRLGGFATCLCAEISAEGTLSLANAGHLAPYLNGEEVSLDSGLPLGIAPDSAYTESAFRLASSDRLVFLSDGVVEAQNERGDLFGFDRTRSISTHSAEDIAHTAQAYGQRDDITVLTLTYASAEVMQA